MNKPFILDPQHIVALDELMRVPVNPFKHPSPLDILESIAEPQHSHHCRKCRHDFTLITEDDGDRILPMFCPLCLSPEVEKFRE